MTLPVANHESRITALKRAKRWAQRLPGEQFKPGKTKCKRQMLQALFSTMSPKLDGTHPLDKFKLEE